MSLDPGHFVYIVRCADGSLYTGYARDVKARVRAHNSARGAKYTAGRRPVRLVFSEECGTRSAALKREYALKQLSRKKKLQLLFGSSSRQRHVRRRH